MLATPLGAEDLQALQRRTEYGLGDALRVRLVVLAELPPTGSDKRRLTVAWRARAS